MGCKYVKDFKFPESHGFSASGGKTMVKGYARGGPVKKASTKGGCACGGKVTGMKLGGKVTNDEKKLVKQVAHQTWHTGRMPGVPAHSNKPLIK